MGRKRKVESEKMQAAPAKPRTADRHKPRRTISFKPSVYRALHELAKRNHRPVSWEVEMIAIAALEAAGLWPPEGERD